MKIAIITCYKQPDYVRARTLRTAVQAAPDTEALIIKNRHRCPLRFIEVPLRILWARWHDKPDAYLITFRGYEMLLFMVLAVVRKPIIFDEFINFTEWMDEHDRLRAGSLPYGLFRWWYGRLARQSRFMLADTDAHAKHSASLNRLPLERYRVIPVGTDETVFHPGVGDQKPAKQPFTLVYYGTMLPLHGLSYLLEAARLLQDEPDINFRFIGGKQATAEACATAAQAGARVTHEAWLPFEQLPAIAASANLGLGGPFGDTLQSRFVITGKTYQFLALGQPVLIGRNEATNPFKDKQNCLMVPQADARALTDAIRWAYHHPQELAAIGRRGRQLYEQHFSQTVINKLVQQLVEEL